jgi:sugar lactone lactonase YvrE
MTEVQPKIVNTLTREPHVTLLARDEDKMSAWISMAFWPQHGLFLSDLNSHSIYRIQYGRISKLVSPPANLVAGDFDTVHASSMAFSPSHNVLLIADQIHHVIRQVSINDDGLPGSYGNVTVFAGSSTRLKSKPGFSNGSRLNSKFRSPGGVFATLWGDVLVSDTKNHAIRLIRGDSVSTLAGSGKEGFVDGKANDSRFSSPLGLACTPHGEVLVCDVGNRRIRMINSSGEVSTLAGSGEEGIDDGNHLEASFVHPERLLLTPHGDVLVIDHNIRLIRLDGGVTTLAECTEPYQMVVTEIVSVKPKKRSWSDKLWDLLSGRESSSANRPLTTNLTRKKEIVIKSTRDKKFCLSHMHDRSSDYPIDDSKHEFADEHTTFSSLGDMVLSSEGDLIFTDPASNAAKQIQGIMGLLYPWKSTLRQEALRQEALASDEGSLIELQDSGVLTKSHRRILRAIRSEPPIVLTKLLKPNPFIDYELQVRVISEQDGKETNVSFHLHALILFLVCPILLTEQAVQSLQYLSIPVECYDCLFEFLYGGNLPLDKDAPFWSDFSVLSRTLRLPGLAQHACYRLYKALQKRNSLAYAIELLNRHPNDALVFDAISEYISSQEEIASQSKSALKRRLSSSDALSQMAQTPPTQELRRTKSVTFAVASHPLAHSSSSIPPSHRTWSPPPPTIRASKSMTSSLSEAENVIDVDSVADRVLLHLNRGSSDLPLHQRNKIDVFDILQSKLRLLGSLLRSEPPQKDEQILVPFPELCAPDFFLHVDNEFIPCHGCILYARWPWFASEVDKRCSTTFSQSRYAPFRPSSTFTSSAVYLPSRRVSTSFSDASLAPSAPSTLESWSMRVSKTFERERSIDLPPSSVSPQFVTGLVWYLYSNELHKLPNYHEGLSALSHATEIGLADWKENPIPPFSKLLRRLREPLTNPITLDNCFNLLRLFKYHGYWEHVDKTKSFMRDHAISIIRRPDLLREFQQLSIADQQEITSGVSVSAPMAPQIPLGDDDAAFNVSDQPIEIEPGLPPRLSRQQRQPLLNSDPSAGGVNSGLGMQQENPGGESVQ